MNILIITHYFPPENSIASLRPYSWAKYWSKMGHDVTVLTTKKIARNQDLRLDCTPFRIIEVENSVRTFLLRHYYKGTAGEARITPGRRKSLVVRLKNIFDRRGIITWDARLPNLFDFWCRPAYKAVAAEHWDVTVSTFAPYATHLVAKKLRQRNRTDLWVADYRDLWTESHLFKGLYPFTLFEEYLEKTVNLTADLLTTVSEPLAHQISLRYNVRNVSVITNGFDADDLNAIAEEPYWTDTKIRLVYTGSIHPGTRDPSPLFAAIQNIACSGYAQLLDNFEVIFVGEKGNLDDLIEKYDVSNWVKFRGSVPREDCLRMQRDAHLLLFLEVEAQGVDGILTGKLFEYLCSGTQIIGIGITDSSSTGKFIVDSHGVNFGKDIEKIKEYVVALLKSGNKTNVEVSDELLDRYSRKAQAERLLELIETFNKSRKTLNQPSQVDDEFAPDE